MIVCRVPLPCFINIYYWLGSDSYFIADRRPLHRHTPLPRRPLDIVLSRQICYRDWETSSVGQAIAGHVRRSRQVLQPRLGSLESVVAGRARPRLYRSDLEPDVLLSISRNVPNAGNRTRVKTSSVVCAVSDLWRSSAHSP